MLLVIRSGLTLTVTSPEGSDKPVRARFHSCLLPLVKPGEDRQNDFESMLEGVSSR